MFVNYIIFFRFNTIQHDIELKLILSILKQNQRFNTIQHDIELKPQILELYLNIHRIMLHKWYFFYVN